MSRMFHYALLTLFASALFLVNLGGPTLWDIDEGNNATCAREMLETGNFIVPRFNYDLRVDKPALLYWLQVACYEFFGVHEFSARLPSALAAWLAVLLIYELGRRMFGPPTGLLAGIVLASSIMFSAAAHFANPDALLTLCMLATLAIFWHFHSQDRPDWLIWIGFTSGLAVLAKGPIGIVMPFAIMAAYLMISRQGRDLLNWRLGVGTILFFLVCLPWYILVAAETRGAFLAGFFGTHNVNRFLSPMEGHGGSVFYYPLILLVGGAPWSVFFIIAAWNTTHEMASDRTPGTSVWTHLREVHPRRDPYRFLLVWIIAYVLFFTVSRTKLPNYVLPAYPALALLVAVALERWRKGELAFPRKLMPVSLALLAVTGIFVSVGLLIAGGTIPLSVLRGRYLPGLSAWSGIGIVLTVSAITAWLFMRRQQPTGVLVCTSLGAALFAGMLAGGAARSVNDLKPPQSLVARMGFGPNERMVQVAAYKYFQPSLVFYCRRHVWHVTDEQAVHDLMRSPFPAYLFVPEPVWRELEQRWTLPWRLLGKQRDLYSGKEIMLITNEGT